MARYEEGCDRVCISVFDMLKVKGRAPETWWNSTAVGHVDVEMG